MSRALSILALSFVLPSVADARRRKKKEPEAPKLGWQVEEGWAHGCYFPPDWDSLAELDRRQGRANVLDEMIKQWGGGLDDGVAFSEGIVMDAETVLLGRPEKIEQVSADNLAKCTTSATSGGNTGAWRSWVKAMPARLTEGECMQPFTYTMFDYLDIGTGWQRELPICEGDRVRVTGTVNDRFRITEEGPWINVDGDLDQPAVGGDWPCNLEGCYAGQLVMKFVSEAGIESVVPVGTELIFNAPSHGSISYRINDTTYFDNTWHQKGSLIDHTAIEISPAD